MENPSPPEQRADGCTFIIALILNLVLFLPWAYLLFDVLAGVPTTWWRWIGLIGLPILLIPFTLVTLSFLRDQFRSESPNSNVPDAESEEALNKILNEGTFCIMREGEQGAVPIPIGNLDDMERFVQQLETPEGQKAIEAMLSAPQAPERPLLYMFQHVALREAAFENHPELIKELSGPPRTMMPLLHFRSKAQFRCEMAGLLPEDYDLDESNFEAEQKLFEAVSVSPVRRGGYTAHIVTMPVPEHVTEAYFSAIVFKDDEPKDYMHPSPSTRYFTLEKAEPPTSPLFCEWFRDGSRQNYGEGTAPETRAFADAVFKRMGVK